MANADQAFPATLMDKLVRHLAYETAVDGDGTVGPTDPPDDCYGWLLWGFSCDSTQNGQLDIEYSPDDVNWTLLEQIAVVANIPEDRLYRVTRRY